MRLTHAITAAFATLSTATHAGTLYTLALASEQPATSPSTPTISPRDAFLFLTQRLGLAEFVSLGDVDDATIEIINRAAGSSDTNGGGSSLYAKNTASATRRTLFVLEGWNKEDVLPEVVGRRWNEVAHLSSGSSSNSRKAWTEKMAEMERKRKTGAQSQDKGYAEVIDSARDLPSKPAEIKAALKTMAADSHGEITVYLIPAGASTNDAAWDFLHTLSHNQSPLHKRQPVHPPTSAQKSSSSIGILAGNATIRGPRDRCAASKDQCEARTNGCSGHGHCRMSRTTLRGESKTECWECKCEASKGEPAARGPVYWGGYACHKRDVSVPFWLFAGFAIAAAATVSWGIGMLYGMGEQDLPSVLGAGVAPTLRK